MESNSQPLEHEHTPEAIAERLQSTAEHRDLGDFVLGAVDGTVTTFSIVAGAAGAELTAGVALVLGLANVVADGFSMAVSNYLKSRSDAQIRERYRAIEEKHIEQDPEGEREEIRQIFAAKGFEGEVLEEAVNVIVSDRHRWVDTMLNEEWGLAPTTGSPTRAAGITFVAFAVAGMVPLVPLLVAGSLGTRNTFVVSAIFTAITFLVVGAIRGRVAKSSAWTSSLTTLALGSAAAGMAFGIGYLLRQFTTT